MEIIREAQTQRILLFVFGGMKEDRMPGESSANLWSSAVNPKDLVKSWIEEKKIEVWILKIYLASIISLQLPVLNILVWERILLGCLWLNSSIFINKNLLTERTQMPLLTLLSTTECSLQALPSSPALLVTESLTFCSCEIVGYNN